MKITTKLFWLLSVFLTLSSALFADTVHIGAGTRTLSNMPIRGTAFYSYTQQIYTQEQINLAGEILELRFFLSGFNFGVANSKDWKIYMGHSARNSYNNITDWEPISNLSQVFDGDISPFAPIRDDWVNIPLDTSFHYDNINNLIIAVYEDSPGKQESNIYWRCFDAEAQPGIYFNSDTVIPNPQNPPIATGMSSKVPQIRLFFANTHPPLAPELLSPANGEEVYANARLNWQHTLGAGDPISYDLYLGTNPDPPLLYSGITESSFAPDLQRDTTYYWKVVTNNAIGSSDPSPVWSFKVLSPAVIQIGSDSLYLDIPFNASCGFARSAGIYKEEQIDTRGIITRLAWDVNRICDASIPYKIWLKTTDADSLNYQSWNETIAEAALVKQGTYLFNNYGWHYFSLDNPFVYTGGNLLVGVESNYGGNGSGSVPAYFYVSQNEDPQNQFWYQNGFPPAQSGYLGKITPNLILHLEDAAGDPEYWVEPASHNFGDVVAGGSKSRSFCLSNVGGGELRIDSISLSGSPAFSLDHLPSLPVSLASLKSIGFDLCFAPTQPGEATATITITDNLGTKSSHTVQASGTGKAYLIIGQDSGNFSLPIAASWNFSYSQSIYLQSEIDVPNKRIEKLSYFWNGVGSGNNSNGLTIYMGHTALNNFEFNGDLIPLSQLTPVYRGRPDISVQGWVELQLDFPFLYNNTDNLVIAVSEDAPGYDGAGGYFYCTAQPSIRSGRLYSGINNIDFEHPLRQNIIFSQSIPNIKLQFGDIPATPALFCYPAFLDFGMCMENASSEPQTLRLMNLGAETLYLQANDISLLGADAAMYSIDTSEFPIALGAGESRLLNLHFYPLSEGIKNATLKLVYQSENHDIALSGQGMPAGVAVLGNKRFQSIPPFSSYHTTARTQILFTADELLAAGALAGQFIQHLAFEVSDLYDTTTYNVEIRTKSTAATVLGGFDADSESFRLYYQQTLTVDSLGWLYLSFAEPIFFNGYESLLFELTFNNRNYNFATVTASYNPGKTWVRYQEEESGYDFSSGFNLVYRPNTRFLFSNLGNDEAICVVSLDSYHFGDVAVCGSKSKTFYLANGGAGSLSISDIQLLGSSAMHLGQIPALPFSLIPGQVAQIEVIYSPTAVSEDSATLRLWDNLSGRALHSIPLDGSGVNHITLGNGNSWDWIPISYYSRSSLYECIFTASEMQGFDGKISSIKLTKAYSDYSYRSPIQVWMGSTNESDLSAGWIPATELDLVFDGTIRVSNSFSYNIPIVFPTPYQHLNGDNLVIMIKRPYSTYYAYGGGKYYFLTELKCGERAYFAESIDADCDENNPPFVSSLGIYPVMKLELIPGGVGENNSIVRGHVRNENFEPIAGALIKASNGATAYSDSLGAYSLVLPVGSYAFTLTAEDYRTLQQEGVAVLPNQSTRQNFVMQAKTGDDPELTPTALYRNYPNPFNQTTNIKYEIKDACRVHLEIYNLKGQKVRKLLNEMQDSGSYSIVFDGKNDKGQPLPRGIYFYRLQAGGYCKTRKMMFLRASAG